MSWFEDQIGQREQYDQQLLEKSFVKAARSVYGQTAARRISDEHIITELAIDEILKYYGFDPVEIPDRIADSEEQLDYCLGKYGLMKRSIVLDGKWYTDAFGPLMVFEKQTGKPVVLLPKKLSGNGYFFKDTSQRTVKINRETAELFESEAYCFYKPLPQRKLTVGDILGFINDSTDLSDKRNLVFGAFFAAVIGMLIPMIVRTLTSNFPGAPGNGRLLVSLGVCLLCTVLSISLIGAVNDSIVQRMKNKTLLTFQSAVMMRLLSLPAKFFRSFGTGEMASFSALTDELCTLLISSVVGTGVTVLTGVIYIWQLYYLSGVLANTAMVIVLIMVGYGVFMAFIQSRLSRRQLELAAKEAGMRYNIIRGIEKIKLSGAEKRFFARWLEQYSDSRSLRFNPPVLIRVNRAVTLAIVLVSNVVLFYTASSSFLLQSEFIVFTVVFSLLIGTLGKLTEVAAAIGKAKPILKMTEAVMQTEPETSLNKRYVTSLSGAIELNNVYFRYDENSPYLLNGLSLKIRRGEYVAVVGMTGCGKTTLMKLLLGLELAQRGAVYYGHGENDITTLDLSSLRRRIGAVMQDGDLFQGSIFHNISVSAPQITLDEAWEAARIAGIADDIQAMPMGMQTLVSAGQGGISGGQKQRILIARAIAGKPDILMLDEATSALDNKTQKQLIDALDKMGCTRIVIAHRLSTIKHCDRILVLDGGKIAEEGNYQQLIQKGGLFAELVQRQRLDSPEMSV